MISIKRKSIGATAVAAVALTLVGLTAAPAFAVNVTCGGGNSVNGNYNTFSGQTSENSGSDCGMVGVSVHYAHVGGSSWTTMTYHATDANRSASNVFGSQHTTTVGGVNFYLGG